MFPNEKIEILTKIGEELKDVLINENMHNFPGYANIYAHNPWFTEEFTKISIEHYSNLLKPQKLHEWLSKYTWEQNQSNKTLGIIMAGNIPLVGLHDFLCAYLCDINIIVKPSSKDKLLISWIIDRIKTKTSKTKQKIEITDGTIKGIDAIIATGSNNSNRYFEYYFSNIPSILRKNRNSPAIIKGDESLEELKKLADDIFLFFGLGCRSVSMLYFPENYNFDLLFQAFTKYEHLYFHNKYANNLDYQYAVNIINKVNVINPGMILLIENDNYNSPVSVLHYKFYKFAKEVYDDIHSKMNDIQCVSVNKPNFNFEVKFGQTQFPELSDYADNIDTMNFIKKL